MSESTVGISIQASGGSVPLPANLQPLSTPIARRMRAYFAPVARATGTPTYFDPAQAAGFDADAPPAPWVDLGWIDEFTRKSASRITPVRTGAPAATQSQVRQELEATVSFRFLSWSKLAMALAAGSEHMNLLAEASGSATAPSGGTAAAPARIAAGSTSTELSVDPATSAGIATGDIVAVDVDYTGQTGFVGTGVSGAYVASAASVNSSADYIRRITLNVARVLEVQGSPTSVVLLGTPLLSGAPAVGVGVQVVTGFVDREGGSFFQEWSALFVAEGEQGDWVFFHYPRLQAMAAGSEVTEKLAGPLDWLYLDAHFRALPVTDSNDGAQVLCFRSYLPGVNTLV
jgi:hypothetical protein